MRRALATALEGGAVAVAVLLTATALAHAIAPLAGLRPIAITGGSMVSAIPDGPLVLIDRPAPGPSLLGEVSRVAATVMAAWLAADLVRGRPDGRPTPPRGLERA